jgi:hypothetical protein
MMGSNEESKAVEDEDQVMDFVTLGMFIIGMTCLCFSRRSPFTSYVPVMYQILAQDLDDRHQLGLSVLTSTL